MLHHRQYTLPVIRSLIDHLQAALTACDALLAAQGHGADSHDLLRLELTAIAHVLQAREDARELRVPAGTIGSHVALFLSAIRCLEEAPPASAVVRLEGATTRLIGGHIPVTTLMDLLTVMHDVIQLCFAARDDATEAAVYETTSATSEVLVWATGADIT